LLQAALLRVVGGSLLVMHSVFAVVVACLRSSSSSGRYLLLGSRATAGWGSSSHNVMGQGLLWAGVTCQSQARNLDPVDHESGSA
jgi:hypothetical protein